MMHLDMLTFESVVEFADRVKEEVKEIDVVYLNAGVLNMKAEKVISPEGWEVTIQINVLSTALLAILLVPWMKVAGKGQAHLAFSGSGCE
jgi:NAD(P)-dependent dehydrogenase (short-subunit alcohol dehydrogenase family)